MTEPEGLGVGARAALHALDAALSEHRRALALTASRRETERMARAREVKAAAEAAAAALEQPVARPMRGLRVAETWIEADRARHRLTRGVGAAVEGSELRVTGDGWAARIPIAPGDGPAAAAREAVAAVAAAAPAAEGRARARLARVVASGIAHARACHEAARSLAALDHEAAERHADRARVEAAVAELAERLGPRRPDEPAELRATRARLDQAHVHLAAEPAQPYAWLAGWPPAVAGAMLRDLPEDALEAARPAVLLLAAELADDEPVLAMAARGGEVTAVTPRRALAAEGSDPASTREVQLKSDPGRTSEVQMGSDACWGRLGAVAELVVAAGGGGGAATRAAADPASLLRALAELRDAGLLTPAEHEAKRDEVLRRA